MIKHGLEKCRNHEDGENGDAVGIVTNSSVSYITYSLVMQTGLRRAVYIDI